MRIVSGIVRDFLGNGIALQVDRGAFADPAYNVISGRTLALLAPDAKVGDRVTLTIAVTSPPPVPAQAKRDMRGAPSRPGRQP